MIVQTRDGQVRGSESGGVARFLGIPFARAGRLAPPQPPEPWPGVRDALEVGPIAPQDGGAQFQRADHPQSEDCLSLNVWAPVPLDPGARRPVMVWIHGGAFRQGSGASPLYEASTLAARGDVVVVTINYRLGALGFAAHPSLATDGGACANWGLLDQVEALRWVRDNATALGGDPDNVTVFGESAGAASVGCLVASPLRSDAGGALFHKAIMQSGAALGVPMDTAADLAERLAAEVGADDVPALRDAPLEALMAAQATLLDPRMVRLFAPTIDGHVLDVNGTRALRDGAGTGIPMIIGTNVDEWKLWAPTDPRSRDLDEAGLVRRVARSLGDDGALAVVDGVRAARAARGERVDPNDLWFAIESERFFRHPSLQGAEAQAAHERDTFVYLFEWGSPAMGGWLGACHGLEIAFVFGNQGRAELAAFTGSGPGADALSESMMHAWLAFARSGDPSTGDLPWPRYDPASRPTMVFGAATRVEHDPRREERELVARATRAAARDSRG
jgi:para-nitrobenzyl esterase